MIRKTDVGVVLRNQQHEVGAVEQAAINRALTSGNLTRGPIVEEFEAAVGAVSGAKHAIATTSGTMALWLAYVAVRHCHGMPGLKIVTSPNSFVATTSAALLAGLGVEFIDSTEFGETGFDAHVPVNRGGYCYVPVHYAGAWCQRWAGEIPEDWLVIEDACHAFGVHQIHERAAAAVYSFHPSKPVTTGEGGAVVTNDDGVAATLRMLRDSGRDAEGRVHHVSFQLRMPEISAALGLAQLSGNGYRRRHRVLIARRYAALLDGEDRVSRNHDHGPTTCHLYPIVVDPEKRDAIISAMAEHGLRCLVHYRPIHLEPAYRRMFPRLRMPNAERWGASEISLPIHSGMTASDADVVVAVLGVALTELGARDVRDWWGA